MNVMLLAAGEGTRLCPHTLIRPKPAIPFLNVPLASYSLGFLEGLKIDRLVVNTFHLPTKIVDLFVHMNHGARHLHFSHEIEQILGSGGGLGTAREYFENSGDLILMNGDEVILPFEKDLVARALDLHQKKGALCTLLTIDHPEVGSKFGGVWLDGQGQVRGFGKVAPSSDCKVAEHFIGIQILSPDIFEYLPNGSAANILYDAVTKGIEDGRLVQRFKINCHWYETGNPQDFLQATGETLEILTDPKSSYPQQHLQRILERYSLEAPVLEVSADRRVLKTASVSIDKASPLAGFAVLGAKSKIQARCELKNVVVADHVELAAATHAKNEIFLESN